MAIELVRPSIGGEVATYHRIGEIRVDANGVTGVAILESYRDFSHRAQCGKPIEVREYRFAHQGEPSSMMAYAYARISSLPEWSGATSDDAGPTVAALPIPAAAPSPWHVWDKDQWAWVETPEAVTDARAAARERINVARNAAEREPFAAFGKTFDADDKAIQRILGAAQAAVVAKQLGQPLSIEWTCADNTTLAMDADMLVEIPVILAQAADTLHQRARSLKAQIDAATSLAEIEAVTW